eukprot:SAG22_NODE_7860_length_701_cov_1.531561_2_plen_22_part_01
MYHGAWGRAGGAQAGTRHRGAP